MTRAPQPTGAPVATGPPIKVITLDLENLPEEIPAARPHGEPYRALWALVRSGAAPQHMLKLAFVGDSITRADIERHLHDLGTAPPFSWPALPTPPPRISVVVCSLFSREDGLRAALESISAVAYPDYEILIVDNRPGDHDAPYAWLGDIPHARVLREARPGLSAARNCALRAATGSLIAFTDDDVVVDRLWLDAFARRFAAHPDEVCVAGLVLPTDLETPAQVAFDTYYAGFGPQALRPISHRLARSPRTRLLSRATVRATDDDGRVITTFPLYDLGRYGAGANMAFRTAALRDVGGFDVTLGAGTPALGGEDIGMFARLVWHGHGVAFDPAALVFHRHREDDLALRNQIGSYGIGFTATLLALVCDDPRHLGALIATAPSAARALTLSFARRLRSSPTGGTRQQEATTVAALARLELRGMIQGPAAYASSRRHARRLDAARRRST